MEIGEATAKLAVAAEKVGDWAAAAEIVGVWAIAVEKLGNCAATAGSATEVGVAAVGGRGW